MIWACKFTATSCDRIQKRISETKKKIEKRLEKIEQAKNKEVEKHYWKNKSFPRI